MPNDGKDTQEQARAVALEIVHDILQRAPLGDAWCAPDQSVREHITDIWAGFIATALDRARRERMKDAAVLMCKWCADEIPIVATTEGVMIHMSKEKQVLGACYAWRIHAAI